MTKTTQETKQSIGKRLFVERSDWIHRRSASRIPRMQRGRLDCGHRWMGNGVDLSRMAGSHMLICGHPERATWSAFETSLTRFDRLRHGHVLASQSHFDAYSHAWLLGHSLALKSTTYQGHEILQRLARVDVFRTDPQADPIIHRGKDCGK